MLLSPPRRVDCVLLKTVLPTLGVMLLVWALRLAAICFAICAASGAAPAAVGSQIERLRDLSSLSVPVGLEAAKQLHSSLLGRARRIEALVGHQAVPPLLSALALIPAPGDLITPEKFGGDPTGASDSTAALSSCVAALLEYVSDVSNFDLYLLDAFSVFESRHSHNQEQPCCKSNGLRYPRPWWGHDRSRRRNFQHFCPASLPAARWQLSSRTRHDSSRTSFSPGEIFGRSRKSLVHA
eukprot:SAG31_NODE_810_length_11919_cov_4.480924_4_plen_239_part_00